MKFLFFILLVFTSNLFAQEPVPLLTNTCPIGYRISNNFCYPSGNSLIVVKKLGSMCPSEFKLYNHSGYCIAQNDRIIDKPIQAINNNCPLGYVLENLTEYCIKMY